MRVVLTGAGGGLGSYLVGSLAAAGHEVIGWSGPRSGRPDVDLADPAATDRALAACNPEAIVHAAALSSAEAVRLDPGRAEAVNVAATARLAAWCARHDRRLIFTSTDLVFDGSRPWNREADPARPVLAYGRTKLRAEAGVLACPRGLVARLSLLYGPSRSGRPAYFDRAVAALRRGEPQAFFADEYRTPLDLPTAATVLARLVATDAGGLLHIGGAERVSRFDLMSRVAEGLGLDPGLVRPNRQADVSAAEPRPVDVSLDTTRLAALLPDLVRPTIAAAVSDFARSTGG